MRGFLLDTNVLSERRKENRCDPGVRDWIEHTLVEELFVSVMLINPFSKPKTMGN